MKRMLALLLCALLFTGSAGASVCVRMEESAALLAADGTELVPSGVYDDIVSLGGGLFSAEQDGVCALMDADGQLLTDFIYADMRLQDGLVIAREGENWGLLNGDGSRRSEFIYSLIVPSLSRNCWALRDDPNDVDSDKLYCIDVNGRMKATRIRVREVKRSASEGLLSVRMPENGKYGYCNALGEMCIDAVYDYAGDFRGGAAVVVRDGKYGVIDRKGGVIVPAEYDFLEASPGGFFIASRAPEGAWVFDAQGSELARWEGEDVHIALVGQGYAVLHSDLLEVFDAEGRLILEAPPDATALAGVGDQIIISDGMWGEECVYLSGSDGRFQNLYPLGELEGEAVYACMTANVGRYMNDLLGEVQLSTDMDSARYGLVDGSGGKLLESRYLSIEAVGEDRLAVRTEDRWQLIDIRGNIYWSLAAPMQTEVPSF